MNRDEIRKEARSLMKVLNKDAETHRKNVANLIDEICMCGEGPAATEEFMSAQVLEVAGIFQSVGEAGLRAYSH